MFERAIKDLNIAFVLQQHLIRQKIDYYFTLLPEQVIIGNRFMC